MNAFGEGLRRVRGDRMATHVARAALGHDATAKQIKSFSNYISRIEQGEPGLQNPSLQKMGQLAKGLGMKLTEFFAAIEGVPTLNDPHPEKPSARKEMTAVESDIESKGSMSNGAALPLGVDAAAILSRSILEAAEQIASACDRLTTAFAAAVAPDQDAARREQTATRSARAPKSRAHGTGRTRKSA